MKRAIRSIAIPEILEVGPDRLKNSGKYIYQSGISKIIVFYGEGIKNLFGKDFIDSINEQKGLKILKEYEFDDIRLENLMPKAFDIPSDTEAIVGIGGGKALDVAKYIAFLNNRLFISIPTSTSHDGFASSGCSLIVNEKRVSVRATIPYGIIVDLGIIKSSPLKFIYSGVGDIISKITAVFDWQFEKSQGYGKVDDFAIMIAKKSVNSVCRMPFTAINEDFFIKELVDSLTMSGISMEIAGHSAPASGSEHLISHALDKITSKPQLHGIQVGVATYVMSLVQKHRFERIRTFLTETGFFDHVETLRMSKEDFAKAIDMAPSIKPNRYTYVHIEANRERAKALLVEDEILARILK